MGQVRDRIEAKLREAFDPVELVVTDDSHLHAGHAGAPEGGESHFSVRITAARFEGQNRVAIHRQVNDVLADELAGPVHALALRAGAPNAG